MIELDQKFVLHLPVHKFENERVTAININKVLDNLINILNENNYHSFYITKVNGHYKTRSFDEILITIFTSSNDNRKKPDKIFKEWFQDNNDILRQESYAYEYNNIMYIEETD